MKGKGPAFRSNRLAWRFRKSGGDGQSTKEFENLDAQTRKQLLELSGTENKEIPAIGCFESSDKWMVITSHRVAWSDGKCKQSLPLCEIQDVTVGAAEVLNAGSKMKIRDLNIVTKNGQTHTLTLDPGPPFFGVWNALKMAAAWAD